MLRWTTRIALLGLVASLSACGGPAEESRPDDKPDVATRPTPPPAPAVGPTIEVRYSVMAEVLHVAEGVSVWRRDLPRAMYRAFDDRFGLDEADRKLLKRFAFVRNELWERSSKAQPKVTFAKPFGPEGLFPAAQPDAEAKFWQAVLAAPEPAALRRGLGGIVEPADAEAVAAFLGQLAPRVGELIKEFGGFGQASSQLQATLASGKLPELLDRLGRLCGLQTRGLTFRVYPVWVPEGQPVKAATYGDVIVLELPAGAAPGPEAVAQVVGAVFERMLARVEPRLKVLATNRFVEKAGYRTLPLPLIQGLVDAAGYGLAAPLVAAGPDQVPTWPGDDARKRSAEALTKVLRQAMSKGKKIDGVFALRAAKAHLAANPSRPSDYVDGAMVIAHDAVLQPFKKKVTRWMVWKFPIGQKYNYPRKLDYSPGRSVLMVLTPKDLKLLPEQFNGKPKIVAAMEKAFEGIKAHKGVIVTLPRTSRGYVFITAAKGPEAMAQVAKTFFELDEIPAEMIEID